ncbi:hypothetical protein [Cellulomonas soli]|uniref:Uncharacterized protein n=1 Tax=Cellulomonas soli TaxID=931535 RepID=A0A512PDU5_9CELL|nr:hypothetical protein [Cellulomonas soli]NYI59128.1 hypothetical protein [Cellulomonas soli]GEP69380.1 hypothetical protein CSO01_20950 [Cellulomonas soli]
MPDHPRAGFPGVAYVQLARGLRYARGALRLEQLAPATIWVLDEPTTTVGQISTGAFLDLWWQPHEGVGAPSSVARLRLLGADTHLLGDPLLRVRSPRITGSGLTYDVEVLAGVVPGRAGGCVLFINPPVGPTSH